MRAGNQIAAVIVEAERPARQGVELVPRMRLLRAGYQRVKRAMDIVCALILAVVFLPVAVLAALIIAFDSRPVFFGHMRVGRNRRPFRLWKFRTMVVDADRILEEHLRKNPECAREWAGNHKLRYDPRITRFGRLLRKTSLDELPQLWSVLRGDMSLIGPRPIVAAEMSKYGRAVGLYGLVRPGLTGLWQVSGRNDTQYSRRVELDCHYIRNWTLGLDFKILYKTVGVILRGGGAY